MLLPFLNSTQVQTPVKIEAVSKDSSSTVDTSEASHFENNVQSSEVELDKQSNNDKEKSETNLSTKSTEAESEKATKNSKQASETEQSRERPKETDVNAEKVAADEAEKSDVDLISLNEVLAELVLNIKQVVADNKVTHHIDENVLPNETQEQNGGLEMTIAEIGAFEAIGIDVESNQVNLVQKNTKSEHQKNTKLKIDTTNNTQVDSKIASFDINSDVQVLDSKDETAKQSIHLSNREFISDEETQAHQRNEAEIDKDDDFFAPKNQGHLENRSNNSNAVSLENFSSITDVKNQEGAMPVVEEIKASSLHVVAMASKSLLTASEHQGAAKIDQAFKGISISDLQAKSPTVAMNQIMDARNVINQVLEGLKGNVRQEVPQIQIRLDPPEWGAIHVKMNFDRNEVNVTLLAESQAVKEALDKGVQGLRGQFMQQGLNLGNVNIGVGNGSQNAEKEAREQLSDEDRKQIKVGSVAKNTIKKSVLGRVGDGVLDSHV